MPNLFIVGAPKAGTTSLVKYLQLSDAVFFPSIKEPHYLYHEEVTGRIKQAVISQSEYESLYPKDDYQYLGDASVFGLLYYEQTIKNILELYGNKVKIIIVLRNPVDRAHSAYLQAKRFNEKETGSFLDSFSKNKDNTLVSPMLDYYSGSLYFKAVKAYMDSFENVSIIYSSDLFSNTLEVMSKIYTDLNLNKDVLEMSKLSIHNKGGKDLTGAFRIFLLKKVFTQQFRIFMKKISPKTHSFLKRLVFKYIYQRSLPLSKNDYDYLLEYFETDIRELYSLLNDSQIKEWISVMK